MEFREQGPVSIKKTVLPGMAIPMLKIRRPNGRLIFNMGITIPSKTVVLIETAPRYLRYCWLYRGLFSCGFQLSRRSNTGTSGQHLSPSSASSCIHWPTFGYNFACICISSLSAKPSAYTVQATMEGTIIFCLFWLINIWLRFFWSYDIVFQNRRQDPTK